MMIRAWILLLCLSPYAAVKAQSVVVQPTEFKLIRSGIQFTGNDLFELLIQEKLYVRESPTQYLPGTRVGAFPAGGRIWYGSNGAGLVSLDTATRTYAIYNFSATFKPGHHVRVLHADAEFVFFAMGDFATMGAYGPGLHVYSLERNRFAKVSRIQTKGGMFGFFSSAELVKRPDLSSAGPQVIWDYRSLAKQEFAELSDFFLNNPSSIKRSDSEFILSYFESWKIESFLVQLRFSIADLRRQLQAID